MACSVHNGCITGYTRANIGGGLAYNAITHMKVKKRSGGSRLISVFMPILFISMGERGGVGVVYVMQ